MAHFAEINESNIVVRVLVISDNYELTGQNYLSEQLGLGGTWVQTSYNGAIRKNFAGIGYFYHETLDAFVAPKCHLEAILDNETAQWICGNEEHNVGLS